MSRCPSTWTAFAFAVAICCLTAPGCNPESTSNGTSKNGNGEQPAKVVVEFPDGDPSVPAELGGPGFTGEGWTTEQPYELGDGVAVKGGTFSFRIREWPGNLRLAGTGANTTTNYLIQQLCFMSLLTTDDNELLKWIPSLASHWKISDDQMTFTYRINPKAHWSDGKPVTADDVIASYNLQMDPTTQDPSGQLVFGKFYPPKQISKYIVEVRAKEKNWRNFIYFSGAGLPIMPAHEIGKITGAEYLKKYNYHFPAFSGPYAVYDRDIVKGKSITVTRRSDWWGEDLPWFKNQFNFGKIRFVVVTDTELAFEKAKKGELDYFIVIKAEWWAKDLPDLDQVKKGWLVRQKFYNDAANGVSGLAINMRKPPLDDPRLRKALEYLLEREKLIEKLAYNEYTPMDSYYAGGPYENPQNEKIRYSPEKAVVLLDEAGWKERGPDGILIKDGQRLSLAISYYATENERFLTPYQEACKNVGVEIVLKKEDSEQLWKNLMERNFQLASINWTGLVLPNPETSFHSKLADQNDNNNITGFKNDRVDEICDLYDASFDTQERIELIRELDHIVFDMHPYVLWWYQPCQRVMYWNKFGMPSYGFSRFGESYSEPFIAWWVDPKKEEALKEARRNGTPLPVPPLEIRYWKEQAAVAKKTDEATSTN